MNKLSSVFALLIFLTSCATPTVVNVVGPTDGKLTCNQLDIEIAKANRYAEDAKKEKSMGTGTNVSALLFWLPGFDTLAQYATICNKSSFKSTPIAGLLYETTRTLNMVGYPSCFTNV